MAPAIPAWHPEQRGNKFIVSGTGDITTGPATPGWGWRLVRYSLASVAGATIEFKSAATPITGERIIAANQTLQEPFVGGELTNAGEALVVGAGAGTITGDVWAQQVRLGQDPIV